MKAVGTALPFASGKAIRDAVLSQLTEKLGPMDDFKKIKAKNLKENKKVLVPTPLAIAVVPPPTSTSLLAGILRFRPSERTSPPR